MRREDASRKNIEDLKNISRNTTDVWQRWQLLKSKDCRKSQKRNGWYWRALAISTSLTSRNRLRARSFQRFIYSYRYGHLLLRRFSGKLIQRLMFPSGPCTILFFQIFDDTVDRLCIYYQFIYDEHLFHHATVCYNVFLSTKRYFSF